MIPAFGRPVLCGEPGSGWTRCADVGAEFVTRWEHAVGAQHSREFGRSHPAAAAAHVLGWYAGVPAGLGGALYRLARRAPRQERDAVRVPAERLVRERLLGVARYVGPASPA